MARPPGKMHPEINFANEGVSTDTTAIEAPAPAMAINIPAMIAKRNVLRKDILTFPSPIDI